MSRLLSLLQLHLLLPLLLALFVLLPSASAAADVVAADVATSIGAAEQFLTSSGRRIRFQPWPRQSFCLVSDPCIHINALFAESRRAGGSDRPWVQAFSVRTSNNTLMVMANPSAKPKGRTKTILFADGVPLTEFRGNEKLLGRSLLLNKWGGQQDSFLITALSCHVRILVQLKVSDPMTPELSLDVLDWDSMDGPHGLIGQTFPNRADPKTFASGGSFQKLPEDRVSRRDDSFSTLTVSQALQRVATVEGFAELDGLADDYVTSGVLEPDCVFSRFIHDEKIPVLTTGTGQLRKKIYLRDLE